MEEDAAIRIAGAAREFADAAELLVAFNAEYDDPAPPSSWLAEHLERLSAHGDTSVILVGAPALGVAVLRFRSSLWQPDLEAYLAEFYIVPARRGEGIGARALAQVLAHARECGASYVDLTTTEADEAARWVYEKAGFDCHEGRGEGPLSLYYELDLGSTPGDDNSPSPSRGWGR